MKHHSHDHSDIFSHHHNHSADKNILHAFLLNLFFSIIEIVGGLLTNSFAIVSDSIHDLGDCAAIGFAYVLERHSKKVADDKYTYGYRRYSLVSALVTSVILVAGSVGVITGSISRLTEPKVVDGLGMLVIAVFGLVINGIAAFKTSKGKGINEQAISLHILEDVLGWATVLVGSIFVYAFEWYFVDAILSFGIAVFLLINATKHLWEVLKVLLQRVPVEFDISEYKSKIQNISGIERINDLHIWSLDGETTIATLHIKINEDAALEDYKRIDNAVREESDLFNINHLTVQIDFDSHCAADCCNV